MVQHQPWCQTKTEMPATVVSPNTEFQKKEWILKIVN